MIVVRGAGGGSPWQEASRRLHEILNRAFHESAPEGGRAVADAVRRHFQDKWPGSKHWSPSKVRQGFARGGLDGAEADVEVDVAGATRAYRDLTIRPRLRKYLAIPFKGIKGAPRDYSGAFPVRTKDGKAFLARNAGGRMEFLFSLVRQAFQKRDASIMPADAKLADAYFGAVTKALGEGQT